MTTRDIFRAELARSQSLLKRGMTISILVFVLLAINPLFAEDPTRLGALQALLVLLGIFGFGTWVYSVLRLRKVIVCPSCAKPLNYLIIDPSYSKTAVQFGIPKDLPSNITACPYCHADLGK